MHTYRCICMCISRLLTNPYKSSTFGFVRLQYPGRCSNIMEILTFFSQKLQQNLYHFVFCESCNFLPEQTRCG